MSGKRDFKEIKAPQGSVSSWTTTSKDGSIKFHSKLVWNEGFAPKKQSEFIAAQEVVDSECLRFMDSLTPMRTGMMKKSATLGTVIGSGEIIYLAPYARRQYYNNRGGSPGQPQAKALWFETMKAQHRDDILRAAGRKFK